MSFTLSFAAEPLDLRYDGVDVRLVSVTYVEGQITTHLRIYNGRTETLHFTEDDIWLALGYASVTSFMVLPFLISRFGGSLQN